MRLSAPVLRAAGAASVAGLVLVAGAAVLATSSSSPAFAQAAASPSPTCSGQVLPILGCVAAPGGGASASASATPSASASASVTPSASTSPSASATPCAGQVVPILGCVPTGGGSATPSATPTATTTPTTTSSPTTGPVAPIVSASPSTVKAGASSVITGSGQPGSTIQLVGYSRPSTTNRVLRTGTADENGDFAFTITPTGNTRVFARSTDASGTTDGPSIVVTVRTTLSLTVTRTGTRTYRFSGNVAPKRAGQSVRITYRKGSSQVEVSRTKVAANGSYSVTRTFSGTGTFDFSSRTSTDVTTAGGTSVVRKVTVR
ncbi:MAG: Bacterial Ig domain [Frankiales bacterium]|nr:Bacterial Ig domain [Frankiales bacterium]